MSTKTLDAIDQYDELTEQLKKVTGQRDRAWRALTQYGEHSFNCSLRHGDKVCDCGFHQAIAEAQESTEQ